MNSPKSSIENGEEESMSPEASNEISVSRELS